MIKNFFNVAGADAVKRIAEWIRHKFYTKAEIDEMFSAGAKYEVVDELPSTGVEGTIYLVPSSTSPSGDIYDEYIYVDGDFEKIGTTKADLSNVVRVPTAGTAVGDTTHPVYVNADGEATAGSQYAGGTKLTLNGTDKGADSATAYAPTTGGTAGQYLKSNGNAPSWETMDTAPTENSTKAVTSGGVKTALDGKQASVTITTNANTPTDNDTVIMQDNGNTGTTSFLRRKLSTLWTYIKGKADGFYVPFAFVNLVGDGGNKNLWDNILDGKMWGADQRFNVTWVSYNIESGEVVETKDAKYLFNMADNYYKHPITGEKDIITISPKDGLSSSYLWTYCHGYYYLNFYSTKLPESATLRWKQRNSDTWNTATFETFGRGNQSWRALIPWGNPNLSVYVNTIEITIIGKTDSEVAWPGTSVCNLTHICTRETLGERGVVTKYAIAQNLYGDITAPKFITRGGTASQVVLGNGILQSLPLPINKGGTGATTAIGAEYNILNQVADIDTTLTDTRKIALCNQTKSASNGVFRWIALSNVWTWIKTHFDSSPTSGSGNGITSGGVYSALEEKVNLQPGFTAQQISYSAGNVGKWQKVLRFPEGADLVINMKKTAMGSDSTSTLWFSSSSMGDSYTSLFGNHSVRFIHDGGYVFLVLACKKSTNEPTESYTFQIAHSSVPMSDIVAVTDASPITATPNEPSIVHRAPITTGAVSFNVTSGAGSVAMANHNDFLGNMTSEASNGVVVTMSGATEGQIYRFVFTRNIEGGITFKQSNVAYCTIQGDVNAGDTITLTAVSNTADGWLYEQESAGMTSTDGSVSIDYSSGVPDLSVETVPFNNLVNKAMFQEGDSPYPLAVGEGAEAVRYDENGDILRYEAGQPVLISVDDGEKAYTHSVTSGETYSVKIGNDTVSYTATATGRLFVCKTGIPSTGDSVMDGKWYINAMSQMMVRGAERVQNYYIIAVNTNNNTLAQFDIISWINKPTNTYANYWNTAVGKGTKCLSYASLALGYSYAYGGFSLALHRGKALGFSSIAIGNSTANNYSIAIGNDANALFDNNCIAIGNSVMARGDRSLSVGMQNYSDGQEDVSLGVYCKSGRLVTRDSVNYDRLLIKKFPLAKFSVAGSQCFGYKNISNISESVTLTYSGNSYVVNVEPNRTLMLVNDADAVNIYDSVFGGIEIDGVTYASVGSYSLSMFTLTHIVGNVYAITILEGFEEYGDESSSSAYIYAHYTKSDYSSSYGIAVGNSCESVAGGKAFGQKLVAMNYYQTVLGRYNRLSDSSKFMIGGGTSDANRRNILEIDYDERLRVCSYVGETQTIDMNNQIGSIGNITKAVYRIKWDGTGTVTLTLSASGCVEGQRTAIYADGNDVIAVLANNASQTIVNGRYMDFMFIDGGWRAPQDPWQ